MLHTDIIFADEIVKQSANLPKYQADDSWRQDKQYHNDRFYQVVPKTFNVRPTDAGRRAVIHFNTETKGCRQPGSSSSQQTL